jgi:hypothetical protein
MYVKYIVSDGLLNFLQTPPITNKYDSIGICRLSPLNCHKYYTGQTGQLLNIYSIKSNKDDSKYEVHNSITDIPMEKQNTEWKKQIMQEKA